MEELVWAQHKLAWVTLGNFRAYMLRKGHFGPMLVDVRWKGYSVGYSGPTSVHVLWRG